MVECGQEGSRGRGRACVELLGVQCPAYSSAQFDSAREAEDANDVVCAPVLVLITKPKNSTPKNTHAHTHTRRERQTAAHSTEGAEA